jgi:hypothetical protein
MIVERVELSAHKLPAHTSAALLADSLELVRLLPSPEGQRALLGAILCSRRKVINRNIKNIRFETPVYKISNLELKKKKLP